MGKESQNIGSNNQPFEHSSNGKCQNLHKKGRFISFRTPNPIMVVRNRMKRSGVGANKKSRLKRIEWGFDLTDAKSDGAFIKLLDKFGFKKVYSESPDTVVSRLGGKPFTHGMMFGDRFTEYEPTFENPSGIRITVEHMGGKGDEDGALGYIGIKAPRKAETELMTFLREFRGTNIIEGTDYQGDGTGIVKYVKEENPYENPYITVK